MWICTGEPEKLRWKDEQQVRMMKDRNGNGSTGSTGEMEGWKDNFKELMNDDETLEYKKEDVEVSKDW